MLSGKFNQNNPCISSVRYWKREESVLWPLYHDSAVLDFKNIFERCLRLLQTVFPFL